MGASKRVTELVVQELDRRHSTRYVAVRFGNVMGSAGSVIPVFREQIEAGGAGDGHPSGHDALLHAHPSLVLEAAAMGQGGEISVLDMGEPVKVLDLAKRLIELSGYKPFEGIATVFTGVRPGEKLFEELSLQGEDVAKTRHPKIYIGNLAGRSSADLDAALARMSALAEAGRPAEIRECLAAFLPEARLDGAAVPAAGLRGPFDDAVAFRLALDFRFIFVLPSPLLSREDGGWRQT